MAVETERKFLVKDDSWRERSGEPHICRQGYLAADATKAVRVRVIDQSAFLTIKGASAGISRAEFEYEIPLQDGEELLALCGGRIVEKKRYFIPFGGLTWEVDVFEGRNAGLVLAELELTHEAQAYECPPWVGMEVSEDPRYFNAVLAESPFGEW